MSQMICGNTQAEIDRDTQTNAMENIREQEAAEQWRWTRDTLLRGTSVYTFGKKYNLNEYIINKYHRELNPDYNFVNGYVDGDLDPALKKLVEYEACTLASIIVG